MFLKINKKIKYASLSAIFFLSPLVQFGQVGINTNTPDANADLTLGSKNKGFLVNQIPLTSLSNSSPLANSDIKDGTIVYNTNTTPDFSDCVFVWSDGKWNTLLLNSGEHQDFMNIVYKQTGTASSDIVTFTTDTYTEIGALTSTVEAPKDGKFIISTILYSKMNTNGNGVADFYVGIVNYNIEIKDLTTGSIVATSSSSSSNFVSYIPPASGSGSGYGNASNNPASAPSEDEISVIKGHQYQIKISGMAKTSDPSFLTLVGGTYSWTNPVTGVQYNVFSALKVDFLSDPYY